MAKPKNITGDHIRKLRMALDISVTQLAENLGLSISALSRIETKDRRVQDYELESIARALGVTVADLYDAPTPDAGEDVELTPGIMVSHQLYEELYRIFGENTSLCFQLLELMRVGPPEFQRVLESLADLARAQDQKSTA